jgi:hypothetical protein
VTESAERVEVTLAESACACRVTGKCDTCKRWHNTLTRVHAVILERQEIARRNRSERYRGHERG